MRKCISPAAMINSEPIYGLIYSCLMIIQFLLLASFYLPKFRIQITCQWRSNKSRKYGSLYGCCGNFCCHKHFSRVFKTLFVLHPTILPKFLINGIEKLLGFSDLKFVTSAIENMLKSSPFINELISQQKLYCSIHHRNALVHNKCIKGHLAI